MKSDRWPFFIGAVGLLLLVAGDLLGATHYVRTDGDDAKCTGVVDAPYAGQGSSCAFATPQACADAVREPGDSCLFHAGVFRSCPSSPVPFHGQTRTAIMKIINKSGTASSPILFRGIGDGPVIFEASLLGSGDHCDRAIIVDASNYVTIGGTGPHEGLVFRGDFDMNKLANGAGVARDMGTVAIVGGENSSGACSTHTRIVGNTFEGSAEQSLVGETSAEIVLWRRGAHNCREGAEIAYNRITWRAAQNAIGMPDGSGSCCSDSTLCEQPRDPMRIHHNSMTWASAHGTYRSNPIGGRGMSDLYVHDNWIQNGTPKLKTSNSQTFLIRDSKRVRLYNNYVQVFGGTTFVYLQHGCYPLATTGVKDEDYVIYNNTFYGTASGIHVENVQGAQIRNNIFLGASEAEEMPVAIRVDDLEGEPTSRSQIGHLLFQNVKTPWGRSQSCARLFDESSCDAERTNLYADPRVESLGDIPIPFLRLRLDSPARDAGRRDSSVPTEDYEGHPRDQFPDIGADEFIEPSRREVVPTRRRP